MRSTKRSNDKKIGLKPKDLTPNKDPRGGAKKFSRPSRDGLQVNHNEMFLAERNIAMNKDPRGSVKFSRLSSNITQCCLLGAFVWLPWLSWLFGDGLNVNHNEMFLEDLS